MDRKTREIGDDCTWWDLRVGLSRAAGKAVESRSGSGSRYSESVDLDTVGERQLSQKYPPCKRLVLENDGGSETSDTALKRDITGLLA